jgi:circadian clock protein KaiB
MVEAWSVWTGGVSVPVLQWGGVRISIGGWASCSKVAARVLWRAKVRGSGVQDPPRRQSVRVAALSRASWVGLGDRGAVVTIYSLRLYVAGQTERSEAALANLRLLCEAHLAGRYELEVVDATERPDQAEQDRILATPTVLRLAPAPQRRVIGDLSDHGRTAAALGLPDPDVVVSEA